MLRRIGAATAVAKGRWSEGGQCRPQLAAWAGMQELHARSLYLQGLLLASPEFVEAKFPGKGDWLRRLQAWSRDQGLDPVQACISFFRSTSLLQVAVIGVTNVAQLQQLAHAWDTAPVLDWTDWACDAPDWVDPRSWGHR